MTRLIRVAATQMGPNGRADSRGDVLARMVRLLEETAAQGATLVVFPELAFTTFFPRWLLEGGALDAFHERAMPDPAVQPLFDRARALGVGFYAGCAELTPDGRLLVADGRYVAGDEAATTAAGVAAIRRVWDLPEARAALSGQADQARIKPESPAHQLKADGTLVHGWFRRMSQSCLRPR